MTPRQHPAEPSTRTPSRDPRAPRDPEVLPANPRDIHGASWLDRLAAAVERAPLPAWALYLPLFAALAIVSQVPTWLDGSQPWGRFEGQHLLIAAWCLFPVALKQRLNHLARSAFDQIEPWLGIEPERAAYLRAELTLLPPRPALLAGGLGALSFWLLFFLSPGLFGAVRSSPLNGVVSLGLLTVNFALVATIALHTARQLDTVRRIYATAPPMDLLHLDPLYALSNLTAHTGISWAIILYISIAVTPGALSSPIALGLIALQGAAVLAAFTLPLLGAHRRLVAEKSRHLAELAVRLRSALTLLHARADQADLAEMDAIHKMILSLTAERELLQKTATWPWQPGTPIAVLSALLLPLGIFLVQKLLERLLSL